MFIHDYKSLSAITKDLPPTTQYNGRIRFIFLCYLFSTSYPPPELRNTASKGLLPLLFENIFRLKTKKKID